MVKRPNPIALQLGRRLRSLRLNKSLTQEELADRAKLGLTHIQFLEGKNPPSPTLLTLQKLAKGFDIPIWELLRFED